MRGALILAQTEIIKTIFYHEVERESRKTARAACARNNSTLRVF